MDDHFPAVLESAPAPAPRRLHIDDDGWVYDAETGEVLGHDRLRERFDVETVEDAEWVLALRAKCEADLAALDARLNALAANMQALRAGQIRRLAWWDYRFAPALVEFARGQLRGKGRTAMFSWGRVAFRAAAGTNEILDMEAAVNWMRTWSPEKVKRKVVETVTVKDVLAVRQAVAAEFGEEAEHLPWLKCSGPAEHATISTGIHVKGT